MDILFFKALHLIGMVAWFAGLFYLVRLFVYHAEALEKPEVEREVLTHQYALMERRLLKIITRPAMIITFIGGVTLFFLNPVYIQQPWMHVKLTLVILLAGYSEGCSFMMKKLAKGQMPMTATGFRLFNEVPTLFLVAIVLLAVFRDQLSMLNLLLILVLLIVFLVTATLLYKRYRNRIQRPD